MKNYFLLLLFCLLFNLLNANNSYLPIVHKETITTTDPPVANFDIPSKISCIGNHMTLTDQTNNVPTSWTWNISPNTFTYQNGKSVNSQNPEIIFNSAGTYNISLTSSNVHGSNSITKTLQVVGIGTIPFFEGFTNTVPPTDWSVINPDAPGETWEAVVLGGPQGNPTQVARMDNYSYNAAGQLDELVMPAIDLSTAVNPKLSFNVAYAAYSSANSERLQILYSTDFGVTFNPTTYDKSDQVLATGGYQTSGWGPTSTGDWRLEEIDISAYSSAQTIFKFVQTCGYGNGLFIEDVKIEGQVLPVELTEFDAYQKDCQIELQWETASEENFSHYELEYSRNGADFIMLDKVLGKGEASNYSYVYTPSNTSNYYRLKMIDLDGTIEYSKIILVESECDTQSDIAIYPNPATNFLTIENEEPADLQIINAQGQLVIKRFISERETINISKLSSGVYFVNLTQNGKQYNQHFVKR